MCFDCIFLNKFLNNKFVYKHYKNCWIVDLRIRSCSEIDTINPRRNIKFLFFSNKASLAYLWFRLADFRLVCLEDKALKAITI